jgi:hypothetical protein
VQLVRNMPLPVTDIGIVSRDISCTVSWVNFFRQT